MIKVVVASTLVGVIALLGLPSEAMAEPNPCGGPLTQQGCWEAVNGKIRGGRRVEVIRSATTESGSSAPAAATAAPNEHSDMLAAYCADLRRNGDTAGTTPPGSEFLCGFLPAVWRVVPGRGEVASAFRELALYRGEVRTDPERASLVNLETYFWCGDAAGRSCAAIGEGERTVTLLGQVVRIRPRIVSYDWRFGDGGGQRVTAGRAVHTYADPGIMPVSVTLTWTADYAVGGGQFQALGETTTTTSPIRLLPVREAETVVVAGG